MDVNRPMSSGGKVVQTALDEDDYERFRQLAEERDLSVKEAARRALTMWTDSEATHDPSDPLFRIDDPFPEDEEGPQTSAANIESARGSRTGRDRARNPGRIPSQSPSATSARRRSALPRGRS
ncbi:hypothetical protein BRC81_12070 [Halobacteriales archaeon QS_1_68_20]|nr:MAG: hypothetical protein BRC81_12070 [Halobacteriales archaeon QS_1_68_20]